MTSTPRQHPNNVDFATWHIYGICTRANHAPFRKSWTDARASELRIAQAFGQKPDRYLPSFLNYAFGWLTKT